VRRRSPPERRSRASSSVVYVTFLRSRFRSSILALLLARLDIRGRHGMWSSDIQPEDRGFLHGSIANAEARALIHRQMRNVVTVETGSRICRPCQPGVSYRNTVVFRDVGRENDGLDAAHHTADAAHDHSLAAGSSATLCTVSGTGAATTSASSCVAARGSAGRCQRIGRAGSGSSREMSGGTGKSLRSRS